MQGMSRAGLSAGFIFLSSCVGQVQMKPISPKAISEGYQKETVLDGIIVYRPRTVKEVDMLTQINIPLAKGSNTATVSGECNPVPIRKITVIADVDHPYLLHYDHGILEGYTFGATLTNDGILIGINTVSAPDQGKTIANLASAASSAAAAALERPPVQTKPGLPDCTVTPVLDHFDPLQLP